MISIAPSSHDIRWDTPGFSEAKSTPGTHQRGVGEAPWLQPDICHYNLNRRYPRHDILVTVKKINLIYPCLFL